MNKCSPHYSAPEEILVYLIARTMEGPRAERLAAAFILRCLRINGSPEDTAAYLSDPDDPELAEIAPQVHRLASRLGLIG